MLMPKHHITSYHMTSPTCNAVLHFLQVAQSYPHQARVQHQLVLVGGPHGFGRQVDKENACVARGHPVVTDDGVAKATDHHLVATVQQYLSIDHRFALQVTPDPHLSGRMYMNRVKKKGVDF